jgi:hypothetical protein
MKVSSNGGGHSGGIGFESPRCVEIETRRLPAWPKKKRPAGNCGALRCHQ